MRYTKDQIMAHLYTCKQGKCKKTISGWWKDSAFEIYEVLDSLQKELKIEGNLCEIGTWYGRSFLPLRNFAEEHELCIGIDIFKTPQCHSALLSNIKKCFGNLNGCKIVKGGTSSDKLTALADCSPVQIFYIDGNHTYKGATVDLNVAKETLHKDGIMFLDDYENPRYGPAVTKAVTDFISSNKEFSLAFSSSQRIFLCQQHMVEPYVSAMAELNWVVSKDVGFTNLINFEHPHGDNAWQATHTQGKRAK